MPETYQVRLRDYDYNLVALFDAWEDLRVSRVVSEPGAYALQISGDDARRSLFVRDTRVEVWRAWPEMGIPWYLEFEGWHLDGVDYADEDGVEHFQSAGVGYLHMLKRTIIEAAAGSAGSAKSGKAEKVAKAWVAEQLGSLAGARARLGFSIEADAGRGKRVELQRTYRNVYDVVAEVALRGGGEIDVVGTAGGGYEFRWYQGQRGSDRSATILFAKERGNMSKPRLERKASGLVNAVLVGGQNDAADVRQTVWRTDPASIAASPWGRMEDFSDARNEETLAALEGKGDAILEETRGRARLSFVPVQTPGCVYGRDYFFGDRVSARYRGTVYSQVVRSVEIAVNADGRKLDVRLEDV